jgi:hypothetical protein
LEDTAPFPASGIETGPPSRLDAAGDVIKSTDIHDLAYAAIDHCEDVANIVEMTGVRDE